MKKMVSKLLVLFVAAVITVGPTITTSSAEASQNEKIEAHESTNVEKIFYLTGGNGSGWGSF